MKVFSFATDKGATQIGIEFGADLYNFSLSWEIYKQLKNRGKGPRLDFLQIMVEAEFLSVETFQEVMNSLMEVRRLDDLKLTGEISYQPPINRPQKILCVGRNYEDHAKEFGNEAPDEPVFFSKSPSAIIAHEQTIRLPAKVGRVDYEGELAVVIGKTAANISVGRAMDYIAGYTILNDVTARAMQKADIEAANPWFRSKSFDTFCPFGPFLVPREAIANYQDLELEVRVNGKRRQHAKISQMVFGIEKIIAYISNHLTLQAGDIIATGTPAGVGELAAGDIVECEISQIGTLRNPVG